MNHLLFDAFLSSEDMADAFDAPRLVQAMLDFEAALSAAQAREGVMSEANASAIGQSCDVALYDIPALLQAGRRAGSLAIPLVKALTARVASTDADAARQVHKGSTSQDVLDTANVLLTREAVTLLLVDLDKLIHVLCGIAQAHAGTPVLARTLMQPATVTTFGFKVMGWVAALSRCRKALSAQAAQALALQLGGAIGTLGAMGTHGPAVVQAVAATLKLRAPTSCWHTQRDEWVRLGAEVGILSGVLGKVATDLALMAQGEVGELAEPSGAGRGGSSAMPHKRNPVSSMIAKAASFRTPAQVATLLACMPQEHERGLGNWQAELAEWPHLFMSAHGALRALCEAFDGLQVDATRMRSNIDALQGLVFAEAAGHVLAEAIGRTLAHEVMEALSQQCVAQGEHLLQLTLSHVSATEALRGHVDIHALQRAFDPVEAGQHAAALTHQALQALAAS